MPAKTEPNVVPDVLGKKGRSRMIAQMIAGIQEKQFNLELMQEANGHVDDDAVPGAQSEKEGEDAPTYQQQRIQLKKSEKRIADAYPELMPSVRRLVREAMEEEEVLD